MTDAFLGRKINFAAGPFVLKNGLHVKESNEKLYGQLGTKILLL